MMETKLTLQSVIRKIPRLYSDVPQLFMTRGNPDYLTTLSQST